VNLQSAPSDRMLPAPRTLRPGPLAASVCGLTLLTCALAHSAAAQSLRGSRASLDRQNRVARQEDFTYIDTPNRLRFFADHGWLVRVRPNADFDLHAVSFPYARPEVELFIRRLSGQYRRACGEPLVVTSLTRPTTRQPRNASSRSVHPTGMALDLRYSWNRNCRRWLEGVLKDLEGGGILEATLERHPRHYHVALFPSPYAHYVARLKARRAEAEQEVAEEVAAAEALEYRVQRGDSLWRIARDHGISVDDLRSYNGIRGNRIVAGQVIDVPVGR
jgi:hypothetical protein